VPSHDHAQRRRALRKQREKGCSIYIDAGALRRAGIDPDGPPPFYRTWAGRGGSVLVRLYLKEW
jgi:hypothetical protein